MKTDVGRVIRRLRKASKMTLEELAALVDTDAANLSRIERGLQGYTPDGLERIAAALGTTAATILSNAEDTGDLCNPRPLSDEQELLNNYRRLRGNARYLAMMMISELARQAG